MTYASLALVLLVVIAGVACAGLIAWLSRSIDQQNIAADEPGD